MFNRLLSGYSRLLIWLMSLAVLLMLVPVSLQIFSRFTDFIPRYIWTEEASRFLLVWTVMLGAIIGVREGTHFDVDVWPTLGKRGNAVLRMVSNAFVLILALVFSYWGYQFADFGWEQTSEIADLPMWTIFIAWPLAGISWVLFTIANYQRDIAILRGAHIEVNEIKGSLT